MAYALQYGKYTRWLSLMSAFSKMLYIKLAEAQLGQDVGGALLSRQVNATEICMKAKHFNKNQSLCVERLTCCTSNAFGSNWSKARSRQSERALEGDTQIICT